MTSREQFEAWFKREIIETPDFEFNTFNDDAGEYAVTEDDNIDLYLQVQAMYMAWQASRDALEIKLPPAINTEEIGVAISKERTMARLAFAGVMVKGE